MHPVVSLHESNFPAPFRDWILDVSERMQCPADYIAITAIVEAAAIIGTGCGIKPKQHDDWLVIPNLWGGLVGHPGKLKSPAVAEALHPLGQLEAAAKKAFDAEFASYLADMELYKAGREALKDALVKSSKQALQRKSSTNDFDTLSLKEKLMQVKEPLKPIWKRYKTNDATIEKLSELLAENPRGLLLYRDELVGLLSSWDREGREGDRAFFLEAWNGYGSLTTDRISRGTVHTENLCLSIFGNIQPAKLAHYLDRAIRGIDNDGLLQRFQLLIYPDQLKHWQLIDRAPNRQAKERANSIFHKLATMDFVREGACKDEGDRYAYYRFNEEAQAFFNEWLSTLEQTQLQKDDPPILLEHLSKYRSLMPSLSLIFHLITVADGQPSQHITVESVRMAWVWVLYLEQHARRIYGMANSIVQQAAIKLGNKILAGELQLIFSVRDIYRKEWTLLENREIVQKACEELVDADWLGVASHQQSTGRPKSPVYVVNPKLIRDKVKTE
ncbi:MAG: hypothetical protein A3F14_05565 [Gammaproteobacteria bacterium RIFCSPHIGHO2_12_FULL_43_28]|nr:MAG: hypothetical protein A3F14_05565 [Gammaproteobacteria bacterium RIFCSPHIGHO2_12_FULL_43_28]